MKVEATIEVNLAPVTTARMMWDDWDAKRQADFLFAVANKLHNDPAKTRVQIACVMDEIYKTSTQEEQRRIEKLLETMVEYFHGRKA